MIVAMGAMGRDDRTPGRAPAHHPAGPERLAHWDTMSARAGRGD